MALFVLILDSRVMSAGMRNAIKVFKITLSNYSRRFDDDELKEELVEFIDSYIRTKIVGADDLIVTNGIEKIQDNDVLLTYACSYVVEQLFIQAHKQGKKFRVVIVDNGPKFEGKALLHRLIQKGIDCTYTLLTGLSYVIKEVSKVFTGAQALLSNGSVISRAGSAVVALMAHARMLTIFSYFRTHSCFSGL